MEWPAIVPAFTEGIVMNSTDVMRTSLLLERYAELDRELEAALASHRQRRRAADASLDARLKDQGRRRQDLRDNPNDQVVMVRAVGGLPRTVYHSLRGMCGRGPGAGAELLLEHEAKRRSMRRCTACRWPQSQSRVPEGGAS